MAKHEVSRSGARDLDEKRDFSAKPVESKSSLQAHSQHFWIDAKLHFFKPKFSMLHFRTSTSMSFYTLYLVLQREY